MIVMDSGCRSVLLSALAGLGLTLAIPSLHAAEPVDLELVIATDVSYSIDMEEARLQRQGIITAFRSPDVIRAIQGGGLGRIGVAYIDFSSRPYNTLVLDWRIIDDEASAAAFADALAQAPLSRGQSTSISDAIEMAAEMLDTNNLEGTRRAIDISGDGPNNAGRRVDTVRDETVAKGITINGLPIINQADRWNTRYFLEDLDRYFESCVIGGSGSFVVVAADFQDFARAIRQKLILEIAGIAPERTAAANSRVPSPMKISATSSLMLTQATPPAAGAGYEKGCDIGERLRRGIWRGEP